MSRRARARAPRHSPTTLVAGVLMHAVALGSRWPSLGRLAAGLGAAALFVGRWR